MKRPKLAIVSFSASYLLSVVLAAVVVGVVLTRGPVVGVGVLGAFVVLLAGLKRPELPLTLGSVATLAAGPFGPIAVAGGVVLLLGAAGATIALLTARWLVPWRSLLLPALILAALGFRISLELDGELAGDVAKCLAALVLALACAQRHQDLIKMTTLTGFLFVSASLTLGRLDATGTRLEGISGNPNRMVLGVLIFLPFFITIAVKSGPLISRAVCLTGIVFSILLISGSGSAQGFAGLALTVLVLAICAAHKLTVPARLGAGLACLAGFVLAVGPSWRLVSTSSDLGTLSGRTPIYSAAIREILKQPFIGSGRQRISEGLIFDRSAHSVILGLAVTGGVLLGLTWVVLLIILSRVALRLISRSDILAAVPLVLIVEQFVQTIHLVPLVWQIIALFLLLPRPAALPPSSSIRTGPSWEMAK